MLGRSLEAIDPVSKANAREAERVVAVKTVGWNFDGYAIRLVIEIGSDLEIFGVAETMGVFIPKSSDFSAVEVLHLHGEKDEMVAKSGHNSLGFEITRIDKELDTVPFAKIGLPNFLERAMDGKVEAEFFKIPGCIHIGKSLFIEEVVRRRE
jgi:hypothetical protein